MTLEKDIERSVCKYASGLGWLVYKFVSPAHRSVPDRIFIRGGRVFMIEFKGPGKRATEKQSREAGRLMHQGIPVYTCDSVDGGKAIVDYQSEEYVPDDSAY